MGPMHSPILSEAISCYYMHIRTLQTNRIDIRYTPLYHQTLVDKYLLLLLLLLLFEIHINFMSTGH